MEATPNNMVDLSPTVSITPILLLFFVYFHIWKHAVDPTNSTQQVGHRLQNWLWPSLRVGAVLYPPQVIPYGIHGMEGGIHGISEGFHGMVDGFHEISDGFRVFEGMDSMCLGDGLHEISDGFHNISWVESTWNPYGSMES
jgi:hypothetical protein